MEWSASSFVSEEKSELRRWKSALQSVGLGGGLSSACKRAGDMSSGEHANTRSKLAHTVGPGLGRVNARYREPGAGWRDLA